ncbi:DUF3592 domain-containing protein [Terrabacter carboxydivorans]|uniref:DUF3592 domain-containing protein n=1 Tax=Terrabacter carboxydivorans TaxID=619730 RepID=A0ABP5YF53_9MICO
MRAVLYAVWVLFVLAAAFSLVRVVRQRRRHEQRTAGWPRTTAVVTGSRAGWTSGVGSTTRNRRFWPTYRFTDPSGTTCTGESQVSDVNAPEPGDVLEVAYDPRNPAESFVVSSQERTAIGCLIPFFVVFSAALLWFVAHFPLP